MGLDITILVGTMTGTAQLVAQELELRLDDGDTIAEIYRQRATSRGKGSEVWGWSTAYGRPEAPKAPAAAPGAPAAAPGGKS